MISASSRCIALGAALAFAGTAGAAGRAVPDAAALYHDYCSVCHGDRGDGRSRARQGLVPPPRDFTAPGLAASLSRERMIEVTLHGKPGTAMVGWQSRLGRREAEAIVDYLRTTFMRTGAAPAATRAASGMAAPLPDGLHGDVVAGKTFYESNCATCHGVGGAGDGPRAYFIFPKPRNFLGREARAALNRPALFRATRDGVAGREMPAWSKVLSDQEIANVSEYVFQAFIRSGARPPGRAAHGNPASRATPPKLPTQILPSARLAIEKTLLANSPSRVV
jgi:mono/diheme cytochrome c family protein